jgi:crotonobetainyl-CoA:carnitine CoA-transferase CaiB-like acyl-CoA transferase
MLKPLEGMTVIDLSHRLPGPMCGKVLADLGAKVIKIEDHKFQDPFLSGLFASFDESFKDWYEALNKNKLIKRFDFNSEIDQSEIRKIVENADAVIMGLPDSTRKKLKLTNDDLNFSKPFVSIELLASKNHNKSLHDLNALADTGLLGLHVQGRNEKIIDPPFLPISGITFGHKAATDLLAYFTVALKTNKAQFVKTYLDESADEIYGIFWPKKDRQNQRKKYLHNGQYPCYTIYQTKDGHYLALAAVEEKFWNRVCEVFNINKELDRFYDKDRSVFEIISSTFLKLSVAEIESKMGSEDMCLSIIA